MSTNDKIKTIKNDSGKAKEKNIHEGHRARLTDVVYNAGLENMSKFQVMEFFLTYIMPRGDVNPLAHRLLDKFETFTHVIEADIEDLKQVKGINDRSAKLIHGFHEMFYYFMDCRMAKKTAVKNLAEILDIVEDQLRFRNTEHMIFLALSPANIITHKRRVSMNKQNEVGISMMEIGNFLSSSKATSLVIAHGHPYGSACPSEDDEQAFKKVSDFCFSYGVNFVESLIVGEDGIYGQKANVLLREYVDSGDLKMTFNPFLGMRR